MPNMFLGFPVPRARIAEMIEGSAPPKAHAAWHLPDGQDAMFPGDGDQAGKLVQWNGTGFDWIDSPAGGHILSPLAIHPSSFIPQDESTDFRCEPQLLRKGSSTSEKFFTAPVIFPNGVSVTKFTMFAYRNDAAARIQTHLYRVDVGGNKFFMATLEADWTNGAGNIFTESISVPLINNTTNAYCVDVWINPNDNVTDVALFRIEIQFT